MARDHFTGAHDDFDLIDVPLDGTPGRPLLGTNLILPGYEPATVWPMPLILPRRLIWVRQQDGWERTVTERGFERTWIASFNEPNFSPDDHRIAYTSWAAPATPSMSPRSPAAADSSYPMTTTIYARPPGARMAAKIAAQQ